MNISSKLVSICLVAMLSFSLAACGKSLEAHLKSARDYLGKDDYRAAVIELKSVLQKQPANREARLLLGQAYFRAGDYADAEDALKKARELGVKDDRVLPMLARTLIRMGQPQKVLDLGVPGQGLTPTSLAPLQSARAEAQLALGKRAEAEKSIDAGKQADPKQPELLLTQAKLALMDKQKSAAEKQLDTALRSDPKFTDALYLKAALLQSEGKNEDALKIYEQIAANDPSQFRAHLAIADYYMKQGKLDEADEAIKAAEKIAGNVPLVRYTRGVLELRQGHLDKANAALLDVLRMAPKDIRTLLAYAAVSYGLGHYEQSIQSAGRVLGSLPDNLMARRILAASLLKTGDLAGALKTLSPLLAKYPDDATLLALAGEAYLRSRDYEKAMAYLDKASEKEPENAAIKTRLAAGHLAEGQGEAAVSDLEQAARLSTKPSQADLALVVLRLKLKQYDQALQEITAQEKKLPNNPVTENLRAVALLGKQDRAGARQALERALAVKPDFLPAAINLARLDLADHKPDAARKPFEDILAKDPNNAQAMLALADLAAADKQEDEYARWLEQAAKADPKSLRAQQALIDYYLSKKENAKALAQARTASDASPDSLVAVSLLGATQLATGDHDAAVATYTRITQRAPRSPEAFRLLANAQIGNKQFGAARDSLHQALELKPDFVPAQEVLCRLELTDNKPQDALHIAKQIQAQHPKSPVGYALGGDVLVSLKRYSEAINAYQQALNRGTATTNLIKLLGAMTASGDEKGAEHFLTTWIDQHPNDLGARNYAARLYMTSRRSREAITQYEALTRLKPNNVSAINNLAILYQQEKDARALATAEKALKLAPDQPSIQDTLGWILVEEGQELPHALDLLAKAAAKLPKEATVRYHYAFALAQAGKKTEAIKELEATIGSGQKFPDLAKAQALIKSL